MKLLLIRCSVFCIALLALLFHQELWAHGKPVVITTPGGKITVDQSLYANLTDEEVIDNAPLPFGPNLQYIIPGFNITGMIAADVLIIELLPQTLTGLPGPQYLSFWSPANGLGMATNNQSMRVVSAFGQITAFQAEAPVPPELKVTTVTNGVIGMHTHFLNYYLDEFANAADGLYALQVRLKSPQYQSSDPFWIMFDNNITGAEIVAGSNAIMAAAVIVSGPSIWQGVSGANWTAAPNWSGSIPNSTTAEAKFTTTGGAIINLDADQTVNKLTFDATSGNNFTISGPGKLTLAGATPTISTSVANTGTQTVTVNLELANGTTIAANSGTLVLSSPSNSVIGTGVTATVASAATLRLGGAGNALSDGMTHVDVMNNGTLAAMTVGKRVGNIDGAGNTTVTVAGATLTANHVRQTSLSIGIGNIVTIANNGGDAGVSVVSSLSIPGGATPTGTLDLKNNDMVLKNASLAAGLTTLATVTSQVGYASNGLAWNQPGITSTTVQSDIGGGIPTALGILLNNDGGGNALFYGDGVGLPQFSGQSVNENALLVKYTWLGDADINGVVDSVDFSLFQAGFGMAAPYSAWAFGDFDYNGTADSVDFALFQAGFAGQTETLLTVGSSNVRAVPEPHAWIWGSLAMLGLAGMWRRLLASDAATLTEPKR